MKELTYIVVESGRGYAVVPEGYCYSRDYPFMSALDAYAHMHLMNMGLTPFNTATESLRYVPEYREFLGLSSL